MNIVINQSPWTKRDLEIIYEDEEVIYCDDCDLSTLMVKLGVYPSTTKARNANRVGQIPLGYTEYKASKKVMLYIWNPSE